MPLYEYKCPEGHVFEVIHGMSDPAPEACQVCGRGPLERVLYPVAVHFKGSGFYTTDYGRGAKRRDGTGKEGEAGSTASESTPKKEEKKAEASKD